MGASAGIPRLCRNRLLLIQPGFRENATWIFWNLQRLITNKLFMEEAMRRKQRRNPSGSADSNDPITRLFGTVVPSSLPESRGA